MSRSCIVIVESDVLARNPLAEYLRDCGYVVLEACNADEARLLLGQEPNPVDIVLVDVDMPGENGFALAAWIRSNHSDIEVVLVGTVAKAVDEAGDLCKEGPALTKPYDHKFVLDHIRRLQAARKRNARGD